MNKEITIYDYYKQQILLSLRVSPKSRLVVKVLESDEVLKFNVAGMVFRLIRSL